jgi:hypothetical protein
MQFCFVLVLQKAVSYMSELASRVCGEAGAKAITMPGLREAVSRLTPGSAAQFCTAMFRIGLFGKASACEVIREAQVIQVLFALLARHIRDKDVVLPACSAINWMARFGSTVVKTALRDAHGASVILQAAQVSSLEKSNSDDKSSKETLFLLRFCPQVCLTSEAYQFAVIMSGY